MLPKDQWQKEMEYEFQAYLSGVHSGAVEVATEGTEGKEMEMCPDREACLSLCCHQKIRIGEFHSFSVLELFIIIFLGLFFMLFSAFIDFIVDYARRLRNRFGDRDGKVTQYALLEWNNNSTFDLQHLAHEVLKQGTWARNADSVLVTESDENLAILDITDPRHTRLRTTDALTPGGEHEKIHLREEETDSVENIELQPKRNLSELI